jgi:hypothetical protein
MTAAARVALCRPVDIKARDEKIKALIAEMPLENEKVGCLAGCQASQQLQACLPARRAVKP